MPRLPAVLGIVLAAAAVPVSGCPTEEPPAPPGGDPCAGVETASGTGVSLALLADGLAAPVHATHAGDGTGRVFIVEQEGTIRTLDADGNLDLWLDISQLVGAGDEMGLLSLAFHPDFATNGRFFVDYTDAAEGTSKVSEFGVLGDPAVASPTGDGERVLLSQEQPYSNHNGGQIAFGPDGYLYVGFGDGGGAGDPDGNGQATDTFLGKILRIDVDSGAPYGIPPGNPFVSDPAFLPEIWAWGLRNPWRFSFDRETGEMWIGDVGQWTWEEIDVGRAGANYGWNQTEGDHCFAGGCNTSDFEPPVWEYARDEGICVTGGFVYRGCRMPDLRGTYFYSDFNYFDSPLRSLLWDGTTATAGPVDMGSTGTLLSSFGEDEQGEILLLDYLSGRLWRIDPE